jgi:PAS domain S-box-containing protein
LEFAQKARFGLNVDVVTGQLGLIRTLRGLTPVFGSFCDDAFDEGRFEQHLEASPSRVACWYWVRKLQARFYAGDWTNAVAAAAKARSLLRAASGVSEEADYHFYAALARAAATESATPDERLEHAAALAEHHQRLAIWAEICPENFADRALLVGAEIARLEGRELEAERLYEQAIRSAREQGFVQNEGVAYESAARFHAARGFEAFMDLYLRKARYCYQRWGAHAKVRQLVKLYPRLREIEPAFDSQGTGGAAAEQLEFATVLKVSHAVSGEIILDRLLDRLMRAAIEHAGAERGLLITRRGDELQILAQATTSGADVIVDLSDGNHADAAMPQSLVRYVMRTRDTLILEDASSQNLFSADPYLAQYRARSILCLPLINQSKLIGVLLLENNLAPGVFGPARIAVLKLLASQAAMSLENTSAVNELRLRVNMLQHIPVAAWSVMPDGTPDIVNQLWFEYTGQTADYVNSDPEAWMSIIHPEDRESASRIYWEGIRSGRGFTMEARFLRASDRTYRWHLNRAVAVRDPEGNILRIVGTSTDVHELRRMQEELRDTQAEFGRITRVVTLGELTASIAHEVNQPLGAMVTSAASCARWLAAKPPQMDKAWRALERIVNDGRRAGAIIQRIRALMSRQAPRKDRLDLNETVLEVIALTQYELRRNDIVLETRLTEGLPPVQGDRVQCQQVLLNLIVNAIEAMNEIDQRPRELTILSATDGPDAVRVEVRDTGTGLDPDRATQLFEAFYTTKAEGLGIGLSISRSIVEAHGGRLTAGANAPHGAVFCIWLPVQDQLP